MCLGSSRCTHPYSCEWNSLVVPCEVNSTSGEVVDSSTSLVIGYLNDTSTSANEASHSSGSNGPDLQTQAIKEERNPETLLSSASQSQLEKRGQHYALNCGDGSGPRYKLCSGGPYRYYCKSNGALDNRGPGRHICDALCVCQQVYFIKYCPEAGYLLKECGFSYKNVEAGTAGTVIQSTALPNDSISSNEDTSNSRQRGVSISAERDVELVAAEPAADSETLTKRHNYGLDCTSATSAHQKECKDLGYYCTSGGAVQAPYGRYAPCDAACECRSLYANCIVNRWDMISCVGVHGKSIAEGKKNFMCRCPRQISCRGKEDCI